MQYYENLEDKFQQAVGISNRDERRSSLRSLRQDVDYQLNQWDADYEDPNDGDPSFTRMQMEDELNDLGSRINRELRY